MVTHVPPDTRAYPTLNADDLEQLLPFATHESFEPGVLLLRFGQADVDLFVITSGHVEILNAADGDRHIATRGVGDFIGDIDLITRRPIAFSAKSLGDDSGGHAHLRRSPPIVVARRTHHLFRNQKARAGGRGDQEE